MNMHMERGSFTVVLCGDWNKQFMQPDWFAEHVFENQEMEIGIEGQGTEFYISYKKDKIKVRPTQSKVVFCPLDMQRDTLEVLAGCVNNFLEKAYTPVLDAYGFNIEYTDTESMMLAEVFDGIPDMPKILDLGYEIDTLMMNRTLRRDNIMINMQTAMNQGKTTISFNEHHSSLSVNPVISADMLDEYIQETLRIIRGLEYEMEDE